MRNYAKTYIGDRQAFSRSVKVEAGGDFTWLDPRASQKVYNHSPDGFEWGYGGSGPAQLALAMLIDATGNVGTAHALYQKFKFEFVARFDDRWIITQAEIIAWCEQHLDEIEKWMWSYVGAREYCDHVGRVWRLGDYGDWCQTCMMKLEGTTNV